MFVGYTLYVSESVAIANIRNVVSRYYAFNIAHIPGHKSTGNKTTTQTFFGRINSPFGAVALSWKLRSWNTYIFPWWDGINISLKKGDVIGMSLLELARKQKSSASLAFVRGVHPWLVNSTHKGSVKWKLVPFGESFSRGRTRSVDPTHSIPWLLMTWRHKEPGH